MTGMNLRWVSRALGTPDHQFEHPGYPRLGRSDFADFWCQSRIEPDHSAVPVPWRYGFVDDPDYHPLFAKLKLAQVRIMDIKRLKTEPGPDDLAANAETEQAKLFFTQSPAHNPTGRLLYPPYPTARHR